MKFWVLAHRGFTLIEMAMVLVIIGLVISGGLVGLTSITQSNGITQTNQQLDKIEQALVVYTIQNGCLPCPADPASSSSTSGVGMANDGAFYTSGCATAACTNSPQGVVPWVTLGLAETDITDAFGNRIDYAVTTGLTTASTMKRTNTSTYPAGTLVVQNISQFNAGDHSCTTATDCQTKYGAYVLISHGLDGSYAYTTGTGVAKNDSHSSTTQAANGITSSGRGGSLTYVQDLRSTINGTTYFDDLLRFRTAPVVIQLCGSNACGNPA